MKIKNLFCSSSLTMYGGIARNKFYSSHLLFKHRVKRERRVRKKDECARSSQSALLLSTQKGNIEHRYLFVFPSFWPHSFGESYERISGSIKKHFIQIYWSQLKNGINMRVNEFNSDLLAWKNDLRGVITKSLIRNFKFETLIKF